VPYYIKLGTYRSILFLICNIIKYVQVLTITKSKRFISIEFSSIKSDVNWFIQTTITFTVIITIMGIQYTILMFIGPATFRRINFSWIASSVVNTADRGLSKNIRQIWHEFSNKMWFKTTGKYQRRWFSQFLIKFWDL